MQRAALYFETYARTVAGALNQAAQKHAKLSPNMLSFLGAIYSAMEEPDALAGLEALRETPSAHDAVLQVYRISI